MSFIAELKRRNVIRMAGLYLVGAWLMVQVLDSLLPMFGAPDWIARTLVMLMAVGFVPALVFAWIFELTPEGLKRDDSVPASESIAPQTARRLDRMIIVVLALALAYFAIDRFVFAPRRDAELVAQTKAGVTVLPGVKTTADSIASIPVKSIAVLPFNDLSPGGDQGYFSDGMAEELLNALAKVKDLKVAGRTSSFSFKGKNEDLRSIGKALGVATVLEGSVRKQGDKVRITAQLIQASDGFHLWSETYDGDLADVFELQERIARSITDALKVVLVGDQEQRLVPVATQSPEAYALFLKATDIFNRRDGAHIPDAIAQLEEAIRLDPVYARAYSKLAAVYAVSSDYTSMSILDTVAATERNARHAIDLAPSLAEPYAALSVTFSAQRRHAEALALLNKAVTLDPRDTTAQFWLGTQLIRTGYTSQGIAQLDRALALDPLLPNALTWRGRQHVYAGELGMARPKIQQAIDSGLSYGEQVMAFLLHAEGNDADAIERYARGVKVFLVRLPDDGGKILAQGCFGDAAARRAAIAMIDAYLSRKPPLITGIIPEALIMMGEPARYLSVAGERPTSNDSAHLQTLWSPQGRAARRLPQFPEFARKVGLVEVWDKYGPPDTCRRRAPGDYVCE